jgi:hypothetical protein
MRNNRRDRIGRSGLGNLRIFLLLGITVSLGTRAWASSPEGPRLSARTGRTPIEIHQVPLTEALKWLGASVEHGYVLFGVELYGYEGKEPVVDLNIPPYTSAGEGLRRIFKQLSEYTFAVLTEHFVSVYPKGAMADPADPLNLKIKGFDVVGESAGVIFTWPERFIPKLKKRTATAPSESEKAHHIDLYVGPVAGGTLVTLHLRDVTVRQILNAVSEATEKAPPKDGLLGWLYLPAPKSSAVNGSLGHWRLFMTLPHNWLEQIHGSGRVAP